LRNFFFLLPTLAQQQQQHHHRGGGIQGYKTNSGCHGRPLPLVSWTGTGEPPGVITTRGDSAGVSPPSSSSQAHTSPPPTRPADESCVRNFIEVDADLRDRSDTGTVHMFITGKPFFRFPSHPRGFALHWIGLARKIVGKQLVFCVFFDASHSQRKKYGGFLLVSSTYFLLSCRIRRMTHASGSSGLRGPNEYPWLRFFFHFFFPIWQSEKAVFLAVPP